MSRYKTSSKFVTSTNSTLPISTGNAKRIDFAFFFLSTHIARMISSRGISSGIRVGNPNLDNVDSIIQTQTTDLKNTDSEIKSKLQLRSKLNQNSPERKGLEREVPEAQKGLKVKEKQLKDLETTKTNIAQAKSELEKKQQELEKQAMTSKMSKKSSTSSVLPSLQSPI